MSTGQRFVLPFQTVIDSTGTPLTGALLAFYLTGSSTPAVTYADQGLSTPNPNPVPAGSDGRFPAIFLDPSVTYKVVLQDENGVQQWSADPVTAPGANSAVYTNYATIAALRAATVSAPTPLVYVQAYSSNVPHGGGWFAFVASDTSSVDNGGTIIKDASGNRYYRLYDGACSIENFGAVQDSGLTDNASTINAALSSCSEVLVPGSVAGAWYGFSEPLTIPSGVRLTGVGANSLLKANQSFGTGSPLLQNASTAPASAAVADSGIIIEDLTLDGNSQGSSLISLVATQSFKVRGVNLKNGAANGLVISAVAANPAVYPQRGWIDDVFVQNCQGNGILVSAGLAIKIEDAVVSSCALSAAANGGIVILAAGATSVGSDISVVNPTVFGCGNGGTPAPTGIYLAAGASTTWNGISVLGGSIANQTGIGVYAQGLSLLTIDGATITGATLDGININGCSYASITGCLVSGCGGWGIHETNAADYSQIQGVQVYNNTAGQISLVGVHSKGPTLGAATFQYQQPSGTSIVETLSSGWNSRQLNTTVSNTIIGASLGGNQVNLPAGTYFVTGSAPAGTGASNTGGTRMRLRNVTSGATILTGSSNWSGNGNIQSSESVSGVIVLGGSGATLEIDTWASANNLTSGSTLSTGDPEVGSTITFIKLA